MTRRELYVYVVDDDAPVRVYRKLDGTLITMYWYRDQWEISSSGTPHAASAINASGGSELTRSPGISVTLQSRSATTVAERVESPSTQSPARNT